MGEVGGYMWTAFINVWISDDSLDSIKNGEKFTAASLKIHPYNTQISVPVICVEVWNKTKAYINQQYENLNIYNVDLTKPE